MKKVLRIEGMSCGHCKAHVEAALSALPGVTAASVDLPAGTATVEGDADDAALRAAVEQAGYDVVS